MIKIDINQDITIYLSPIITTNRMGQREAEIRAVHAIITSTLGSEATLDHYPNGAPYVVGHDINISVSHSRDWAAIAISSAGHMIGLDIESANRAEQLSRVKTRFLSPDELTYWGATSERLLQAWTIKEAAYKAAGVEMADLREIRLTPQSPLITVRDVNVRLLQWTEPITDLGMALVTKDQSFVP